MKKRLLLLGSLLLALNFALIGCSNKSPASLDVPIISDPFENKTDTSESDNQSKVQHLRYGFALHGENAEILEDNTVNVPLWLSGDETSVNVGIRFFIDGILQDYSVNDLNNTSSFNKFDTEVNKETTYQLKTNAKFDKNLERHSISGISILNPDYHPENGEWFFANNHKGLANVTNYISLNDSITSFADDIIITKADPFSPFTSEQKEKYNIRENMSDTVFLLQTENNTNKYTLDKAEDKLDLSFAFVAMQKGITDYRISFYKNHELVKFNGNNDYLDVKAEGGKILETDITIDDVSIGDFLYCICVPISSTSESSFTFKTDSVLVLDSENNSSIQKNTEETATKNPDTSDNISVLRSFNNSVIFQRYDENGLTLCRSSDGVNIDKSVLLTDKESFITDSCKCGENLFVEYSEINEGNLITHGILLDKELEKLKSIGLNNLMDKNSIHSLELITADNNKIYFVDSNNQLFMCDWDGKNKEIFFDPSKLSEFSGISIGEINKSDDYIAFRAIIGDGTKRTYYGIIDMSGKYEILQKNDISAPQVVDNITLWADKHTEPGVQPSGEVVMYRNGKFETIKTSSSTESSYAVLCSNGVIVTQVSNVVTTQQSDKSGAKFTIYANGRSEEITVSEYQYPSVPQIAYVDGKLMITVYDDEQTKTIIKEVGER